MANSSAYNTQAANTPSLISGNGSSAITVLAANNARIGFSIQNVGTTAANILFGSAASATVFHFVLKGGSTNNDGTGGSITFTAGTIYDGIITMFGASTAIVAALEMAP